MILYFFYKNFWYTFPNFLFAFYWAFSGKKVFDDLYLAVFNLLFTSIPLIAKAVLEHDINPLIDVKLKLNEIISFLYYKGKNSMIFNTKNLILNILYGIMISIIMFFIWIYFAQNKFLN